MGRKDSLLHHQYGLLPVCTELNHSCQWKENQLFRVIEEVKRELTDQSYQFDPNIAIGGMIEVPRRRSSR